MLKWIIIGGGIHGTYLSNLLMHQTDIESDDVRVIDPHAKPLAMWSRHTANCGMRYLRSPAVHNIDIDMLSLYQHAKLPPFIGRLNFIPPNNRPSTSLFASHCESVIQRNRLDTIRIEDRAVALKPVSGGIDVVTEQASFRTQNVILAIGLSEQPFRPSWAETIRACGGSIFHIFDVDFDRRNFPDAPSTCIVGGGITSAQVALALCSQLHGRIRLLARHDIRIHNLDFDPCWIGPKCLTTFQQSDYSERRAIVNRARNRGTVPYDIASNLEQKIKDGRIEFMNASISSGKLKNNRIVLNTDQGTVTTDQVILATGFDSRRPGGSLIDQVIRDFDLKTTACGYPVVDAHLRWHEHLFVTGPLSELQIGPCARNIVGARKTGTRIIDYLEKRR